MRSSALQASSARSLMPLFELIEGNELVPFRRLHASADVYAREIGDLVWTSFEEIVGESLFRVARRPRVSVGQPDVVALDEQARVVVIDARRDIDRGELAQALEYAGWACTTNLDELAELYHRGPEAFFGDWQAFTDSSTSQRVRRPPRLTLVARGFHARTEPAFQFLVEHSLPVSALHVALYEDGQGRRYVDVGGEPTRNRWATAVPTEGVRHGRRSCSRAAGSGSPTCSRRA